jgi:hypothetical protein
VRENDRSAIITKSIIKSEAVNDAIPWCHHLRIRLTPNIDSQVEAAGFGPLSPPKESGVFRTGGGT